VRRGKAGDNAAEIQQADGLRLDGPLLVFVTLALILFVALHERLNARFDFGCFYYAAHMVLDGSRHALYSRAAQEAFQLRYQRPPDTLFINPPVALLPLLPLAKLPMVVAFSVWTAVSFGLLFASLKLLQNESGAYYGNWPMLLAPAFAPVLCAFLHGQFSLLVVASYAAAYSLWRRGHRTLGGLALSIATVKYQLVIGFVAVLVLKRRGRELAGFACGCTALLAVSTWLVGVPSLLSYPNFVLHSGLPIPETAHFANWRGLLVILAANHAWLLALVSAATVLGAAWAWKDLDRGFAVAVLASMLVSYHLTPQDLSLALIPFYLSIKAGALPRSQVAMATACCIIGTFAMVTLHVPLALLALPLLAALFWIGAEPYMQRSSANAARDYILSST
jgi:hypothetical protein